jgi:nitrite transporter NirC
MKETLNLISEAGKSKFNTLKSHPAGYLLLSILAGIYIGFGILLVFSISGQLEGSPFTKLLMGSAFACALSLVIIAGAELFTGNNLVMTVSTLKKETTAKDMLRLWGICYIGNLIGSITLAGIFTLTGLCSGNTLTAVMNGVNAKISATPVELLFRGFLCNVLVCLAVWCSFRCKSEAGKLIMVFWCILAFFTSGFEHSIANMTLFSLAVISDSSVLSGCLMNLLFVTIGNILGGSCLALCYYLASEKKR